MFPKFYKLDGKIYIKPMPDYNASSNTQTYTKVGASSTTSVSASGGDKGVIIYAVAPVVDENTSTWILAEYENVALYYAASLDSLYLSATYRGNALTSLTSPLAITLIEVKQNHANNNLINSSLHISGSFNMNL